MPIKKGTVEVEKIYRADYNYLIDYLNWNGGTTTKSELLSSLEWEFSSSKGSIYNALNWDGVIPSDLPEVKRVDYKGSQIFPTQYTVTFIAGWNGSTISTQTINKGSNAVFPSVSYGTGYLSNGYSGSYTNIQSNTTITINRKPIEYTLTIGSKAGVTGVTVKRGSTTLSNGATIYHHDSLTITATATTGYNNPTVTSPITVSGNVNTNNYITTGTIKTYTFTKGTPPTGVSSITVKRGSTTLSNGATISHFDSLVITASAATGYNNPSVTSPISVTGNITDTNYVSAGSRKSYTVTLKSVLGNTEDTINTIGVYHGNDVSIPTINDTRYSPNAYFIEKNSGNNTNITSNRTIYVYIQEINQHSRVSFSNGSYVKTGDTYKINIRMHLNPAGGPISFLVNGHNPTRITLYPGSYRDLVITRNDNRVSYIQESPYNSWSYLVYN